jgi:hypothetical protein
LRLKRPKPITALLSKVRDMGSGVLTTLPKIVASGFVPNAKFAEVTCVVLLIPLTVKLKVAVSRTCGW